MIDTTCYRHHLAWESGYSKALARGRSFVKDIGYPTKITIVVHKVPLNTNDAQHRLQNRKTRIYYQPVVQHASKEPNYEVYHSKYDSTHSNQIAINY